MYIKTPKDIVRLMESARQDYKDGRISEEEFVSICKTLIELINKREN